MSDARDSAATVVLLVAVVLGASAGAAISFTETFSVRDQTVIGAESGLNVTLDRGKEVPAVFSDDATVILQSGNITSHGPANVTVNTLNGTFTSVSALDVSQTGILFEPEDKPQAAAVAGAADTFAFREAQTGDAADGTADFRYSASGSANVTVLGLDPNGGYRAIDTATGAVLDTAAADSSGTVSFDSLSSGTYDVDIRDLQTSPPDIDEDTSSPNSSQTISGSSVTLETSISDADFPTDTVTVTFRVDGSQVDKQTISSNGDVSYTLNNIPDAGDHTWSVTAEDQFGNTDTEQFELLVPSNLSIRDITNESLIKPAQVRVEVLTTGQAVVRDTTSGNVSLEGLPAGEPLLISARSDGYLNRSTLLVRLTQQQSAYLTPENKTVVETEFVLSDRTGDFPPNGTQLLVKRNLNSSGEYKIIAGGEFGAPNRVPVTLLQDEQFRLELIGPDGDRRQLGGYESNTGGVVNLEVGTITFEIPDEQSYAINASFTNLTSARDTQKEGAIRFAFTDPNGETTDLDITIHERGNASNVLFADTVPGPLGNYTTTVLVNGTDYETEWVVDYSSDRNGESVEGTVPVGANRVPFRPLPEFWQSTLSVGALLVVGGLFTSRNVAQGAVVVPALAGVFHLFGWLPAAIGAGAVLLALAVGVSFNYLQSAGGTV